MFWEICSILLFWLHIQRWTTSMANNLGNFNKKEHWESLIGRVSLFTEAVVRRCYNFCNFIRKRLQHRCFPVNIAKFLRKPILKNICERLLLHLAMDDIIPFFMNNIFLQNLELEFQVFVAVIFNEIWVSLLL